MVIKWQYKVLGKKGYLREKSLKNNLVSDIYITKPTRKIQKKLPLHCKHARFSKIQIQQSVKYWYVMWQDTSRFVPAVALLFQQTHVYRFWQRSSKREKHIWRHAKYTIILKPLNYIKPIHNIYHLSNALCPCYELIKTSHFLIAECEWTGRLLRLIVTLAGNTLNVADWVYGAYVGSQWTNCQLWQSLLVSIWQIYSIAEPVQGVCKWYGT